MCNPYPCRHQRLPLLEQLEARTLLAADVPLAGIRGGMLRITGTAGDDVIRLAPAAADPADLAVFAGGNPTPLGTFALADLPRGCRVNAGAGDDQVLVDETNGTVALDGVPLPVVLQG